MDSEQATDHPLTNELEAAAPSAQKKKLRTRIWIWSAALFVLLSGGAAAVYFYTVQFQQSEQQELTFWNATLKVNTAKAYMEYIHRYPDGTYLHDAQSNIVRLKDQVLQVWTNLKYGASEEEVADFLHKYGDTPYREQAAQLLDSLAWANASSQNVQDSYKRYLERVSKGELVGVYKSVAQEKYDYFAQMQFVGGEEWERVQQQVAAFFRSLSKQSYKQLKDLLAPSVTQFYKLQNVTPEAIINSVRNDVSKRGIQSLEYLPDLEQMKIEKDVNNHYWIVVDVEKNIVYKQKKEKTFVATKYKIEMDTDLKLVGIHEAN